MKKYSIVRKSLRLAALGMAALLCAWLPCGVALADIPPLPQNANTYVFDFTSDAVMHAEDVEDMNAAAKELEQKTGAQMVAVLVDFLDGEQIDLYAHDLFTQWGIGKKKENNGALLLFAHGNREITINAGTGLERTLSGAVCGQILDDVVPTLSGGAYSAGMRDAFLATCARIARSYGIELSAALSGNAGQSNSARQGDRYAVRSGSGANQKDEGTNWFGTLIAVLVIWSVLKGLFRPRYTASRRGGGCLPFLLGGFLGNMMRGPFNGRSRGPFNGPFGGPHNIPPMGGWGNIGNFRGGGFGGNGGFKPGGGSSRGGGANRKF